MNEAESSGTREVSGGEEAAAMTSVLAQTPELGSLECRPASPRARQHLGLVPEVNVICCHLLPAIRDHCVVRCPPTKIPLAQLGS